MGQNEEIGASLSVNYTMKSMRGIQLIILVHLQTVHPCVV